MSTSSDDSDDNFLRLHAQAIAEALQQQEASSTSTPTATTTSSTNAATKSRLVHDTYIALCHDDPRVESDAACQCLATALLDPRSPYALSGPLVEGIRQLCDREVGGKPATTTTTTEEALTNTGTCSPKGSAWLAWAIYARIPLLCCQARSLEEAQSYLGSYRPPPPPAAHGDGDGHANVNSDQEEERLPNLLSSLEKNQEADRLATLLSHPPEQKITNKPITTSTNNNNNNNDSNNNNNDLEDEDEVWAAESDPSDFEFESGFSYEQQMTDLQDSFAEWMIDRSDPLKLSRPTTTTTALTWKQVRHAVMDLTSQLTYRQIQSLWITPATSASSASASRSSMTTQALNTLVGSSRGPSDLLAQFTMTLLIPPAINNTTDVATKITIFDSPDEEEDVRQPQRHLQAMAWYPLYVVRDASHHTSALFSQYVSLLQTLIAVDAANHNHNTITSAQPVTSLAPATYVGLASLSALCQQFVTNNGDPATPPTSQTSTSSSEKVEHFRSLRLSILEIADDLTHALEQEDRILRDKTTRGNVSSGENKSAIGDTPTKEDANDDSGSDWIVWTLLPMLEILSNQRLLTGSTVMEKAESTAQRHHPQQASQRWAGLLQSGLFKQWMLRLQSLRNTPSSEGSLVPSSRSNEVLWQLVRRSLLCLIAQSMPATSALGKYAWRFPSFVSLVEIGPSYQKLTDSGDMDNREPFEEKEVDDILWNLLSVELAGSASALAPTIQWKSTAKKSGGISKPLPSRAECEQISWKGFQHLCRKVVRVLETAAQEENKKENDIQDITSTSPQKAESLSGTKQSQSYILLEEQLLVLRGFHRFIDTLVACPMLAKLFVHDLEATACAAVASVGGGEEDTTSGGIGKLFDSIQEALSQYKAPPSEDARVSHQPKQKDEDAKEVTSVKEQQNLTGEVDPSLAKERSQKASLQESIHMIRKVLKVARSLLLTTPTTISTQNLTTSAAKTD